MLIPFLRSEDAAVTVDWVVITAFAVGLGMATVTLLSSGSERTACRLNIAVSETAAYAGATPPDC